MKKTAYMKKIKTTKTTYILLKMLLRYKTGER